MALLWPRDTPEVAGGQGPAPVAGTVMAVRATACPPVPEGDPQPTVACGTVTVRVDAGPDKGKEVSTDIPAGPGAPDVKVGDAVNLVELNDDLTGEPAYSIMDFQRSGPLWILGVVFALAVVAFGRWRGLSALAGLGVTFAILLVFVVPAILDGRPPVLVAVVGSAAIMLIVLYLTHGLNVTTTIAVAGTLISLTITALLSAAATSFTRLSGVADETSSYLNITQGEVNMRGLLLAGIVIGALGVLDDITVTQAATVGELSIANPAYGFRQLYAAATRIGRAHIASVINTVVLAYAGASLPLMLLFATGGTPIGQLLTGELIAQELVRSAVGTIGLIVAVPITTALAAWLASQRLHRAGEPEPAHDHWAPGTRAPGVRERGGETDGAREAGAPAPPAKRGRHSAADEAWDDRPDDDPWAAYTRRDR
jgi:uncharacterized membrane protein